MSNSRLLRPLRFQLSYVPHAEGSCLVTMGRTMVLCVATVEDDAPAHAKARGSGWVHAEYAMLPRAGEQRTNRERASRGGRAQEISRLVGRSLRAGVDLSLLGERTITVDCDVIRADGGTRTAAVNGGFLAMVQALKTLHRAEKLRGWPVRGFVGAVSVGLTERGPVVDMAYADDKDANVDMNFVMMGDGRMVEVQATAEKEPFAPGALDKAQKLARRAIALITAKQKRALGRLP